MKLTTAQILALRDQDFYGLTECKTRTANELVRKGFAKRVGQQHFGFCMVEVTPTGRTALGDEDG